DIDWEIPVLSAEAQHDVGVAELLTEVRRHRAMLEAAGALAVRRRARRREEFKALLLDEFRQKVERALAGGELARTVDAVMEGTLDPYSAAQAILTVLRLESSCPPPCRSATPSGTFPSGPRSRSTSARSSPSPSSSTAWPSACASGAPGVPSRASTGFATASLSS